MKERPTAFRVIDRGTAQALKMLFMECYKRGVNDAYKHGDDEGMLREHTERADGISLFGFVGGTNTKWVYWKNRLCDLAVNVNRYGKLCGFFDRMEPFGRNYLSVAMVMAQVFYNRGITDWLDDSSADDINIFNGRSSWWGGKHNVDNYRLRAYVQDVCSERIDGIGPADDGVLKRKHWEVFMQAFSFSVVAKKR